MRDAALAPQPQSSLGAACYQVVDRAGQTAVLKL